MSVIKKCIIPAAGHGSRWAPVSGYLPKEMLPLIDRPVIEQVINEAISSGIQEIIVILNPQKSVIKDYIEKNKRLQEKAKFFFVNQEGPYGIASAIFSARHLLGDQPFAMALPDLPTLSKKPVLQQLIHKFETLPTDAHVISFDTFPPPTQHLYSECLLEKIDEQIMKVSHFCAKETKNASPHHPDNKLRMSGRYVLQNSILSVIDDVIKRYSDQEIKETDILDEALKKGHQIFGVVVQGHTYDTGTPEGYVRANTAFFKKKLK